MGVMIMLQVKVIHRIIPTKKELMKYKLASDDKCSLCLNTERILKFFKHHGNISYMIHFQIVA